MPVTPIYAALLALMFVFLSALTIRLRRKFRVAVGHGEHPALLRAARVHGNFAEYVPISLLLIYFVEVHTDARAWAHALCWILIAGRVLHAYGVSRINENFRFRIAGMLLTFFVIVAAASRLLRALL